MVEEQMVEREEASADTGAGSAAPLTYAELTAEAERMGITAPERTIRLYVAEGLLSGADMRGVEPTLPRAALGPLRAIDLMRRRFGRSLTEARAVLRGLKEDPGTLAERLAIIDEELLQPVEEGREAAVDGLTREDVDELVRRFLHLVTGGERGPSEISVLDLAHEVLEHAAQARTSASSGDDSGVDEAPGLSIEEAQALEELFISRFDETMARQKRLHHPLDDVTYAAGPRDRLHLGRTRSDEVVDLMKRHRVYDRDLLERLPLDEVSEYRVFTRSLFGRRAIRVVVTAAAISPLEELIVDRCGRSPATVADLDRALAAVAPRDGAFYYVGLMSTTGWEEGALHYVPSAPNVLVCLVERQEGTLWRLRHQSTERWGGLQSLFDPESEREKVERTHRAILGDPELQLRGGHTLLGSLRQRLGVSEGVLDAAVAEVLRRDPDLSVQEVAGRRILKRRRL